MEAIMDCGYCSCTPCECTYRDDYLTETERHRLDKLEFKYKHSTRQDESTGIEEQD